MFQCLRFLGFEVSWNQVFEVSRFQDFEVIRNQDFEVSRNQDFRVMRFLGCNPETFIPRYFKTLI
jgi:hypothetical protein